MEVLSFIATMLTLVVMYLGSGIFIVTAITVSWILVPAHHRPHPCAWPPSPSI